MASKAGTRAQVPWSLVLVCSVKPHVLTLSLEGKGRRKGQVEMRGEEKSVHQREASHCCWVRPNSLT